MGDRARRVYDYVPLAPARRRWYGAAPAIGDASSAAAVRTGAPPGGASNTRAHRPHPPYLRPMTAIATDPTLSRREREVLEQLAHGSQTEEIATTLFLSTHTVRSHVKTLLHKLGARTRAHAVAIAYADGRLLLG